MLKGILKSKNKILHILFKLYYVNIIVLGGNYMDGVIYIAGVYGVGKSTLCERISQLINLPFYSAGDLIGEQVGETYGENKKVRDKEHNQEVLIECINKKMLEEPTLILAGHFCILGNDNRPEKLPVYVYEKMNISSIVLLEAEPCKIIEHLEKRDNKKYSKELIDDFIAQERKCAMEISGILNIPLKIYSMLFSDEDAKNIIDFIEEV